MDYDPARPGIKLLCSLMYDFTKSIKFESKLKEKTIQNLLEGIRRYGLENVSTLSKWIDIPVETARYMIWEELPKNNISIGVSVNLPRIGLGRWSLIVNPSNKSKTEAIESFLKSGVGMIYGARILPSNSMYVQIGIPFGEHYKLREQMEQLRSAQIIESYALEEIEWSRYVSFNPSLYDFKARKWIFDWESLDQNKEPLLTPYEREAQAPLVDYKDLLILKELQSRVPRTLSKLSKKLGFDQHNLRYHYKSHARRAIQGYYVKLVPDNKEDSHNSTMIFSYQVVGETSLADARAAALSIPFTSSVWRTEREYWWYVSCPGEYTNDVLRYVNDKFAKISGLLRCISVDSKTEFNGQIPAEMFDEKTSTWRYDPKISLQVLRK